jgi:adenine phosphoribosyltransferase
LNAGFVPVRKKGKLPAEKISETYELEYGTDTIEMHRDAISEDDIVLIHDDLLATGGTANAVYNMVKQSRCKKRLF